MPASRELPILILQRNALAARHAIVAFFLLVAPTFVFVGVRAAPAYGQFLSESQAVHLLPDTTNGMVAIADADELREQWNETQWGRLAADPLMQPFLAESQEQIEVRLAEAGLNLGVSWDDVMAVASGEIAFGLAVPREEDGHVDSGANGTSVPLKPAAIAMLLVDTRGKDAEVESLLARVSQEWEARGAKPENVDGRQANYHAFTLADPDAGRERTVYATRHADWLLLIDDLAMAEEIVGRFESEDGRSLADQPDFLATYLNLEEHAGSQPVQIHWYVSPFSLLGCLQEIMPDRDRRRDLLEVFARQGFDCVRAAGGSLTLKLGDEDLVHEIWIHAPPTAEAGSPDRFTGAARMLDFPATLGNEDPAPDHPEAAVVGQLSWDLPSAFDVIAPLMDDLQGVEWFQSFLDDLENDLRGPQVKLRYDIIRHLDSPLLYLMDYTDPPTADSEQHLVAIPLKDTDSVREAIDRWMESDPEMTLRKFGELPVWVPLKSTNEGAEEESDNDSPPPDQTGGFDPFAPPPGSVTEDTQSRFLPSPWIAVTEGHLILATGPEILQQYLDQDDRNREAGSVSPAWRARLRDALEQRSGTGSSGRWFAMLDRLARTNWELVRSDSFGDAETLLAKMVRRVLSGREDGGEPWLDTTKMPPFDSIREYLGTGAAAMRQETDGWHVTIVVLPPE